MNIELLPLSMLAVNPNNDRHGELETEEEAISWLLTSRAQHMKKLAIDIVSQRGIYEPPLVSRTGKSQYLVYDGNRRVTCLKLLQNPTLAPTQELKAFFAKLSARWSGELPSQIECQVETDPERIDEILYRRHTGAQGGIGQTSWDDSAKHNFIARTGRSTKNLAESIEKKLVSTARIDKEGVLPRSNLNRLLSSEEFRNAVGISMANGDLVFICDPEKAMDALETIAQDLIGRRLVLGHIWNNSGKRQYLDELRNHGHLPRREDELRVPIPFSYSTPRKTTLPKARPSKFEASLPRQTLIPTDIKYDLVWNQATIRMMNIWSELQQLNIERFPNAAACCLRVLLELSTDHYINSARQVDALETDRLSKKISKTAAHLEAKGSISTKYRKEIERFAQSEELLSASALHRYIHSATYAPSPRHLSAIWDTLAEFLVCCLNQPKAGQYAA